MHCTENAAEGPDTRDPGAGAPHATPAAWASQARPSRRALLQAAGPWLLAGAPALGLLAGCAQRQAPAPATQPVPAAPQAPPSAAGAAAPVPAAAPGLPLGAPVVARTWDEFQILAARRLVAANPGRVYIGPVPQPLLAIPVLEVELRADGSVRAIKVLRHPTQARDTVQLAMDAVRRAAPYGSVARLPRPWRFVEVFLFDDERRFKPRTLDL